MKVDFKAGKLSKPSDILAVGLFEDDKGFSGRIPLDASSKTKLEKELKDKKFTPRCGETYLFCSGKGTVMVFGLGKREKFKLERVRRVAARLLAQAKALKMKSAAIAIDSFEEEFDLSEIAGAAVEGLRLSDYRFLKYKSKPSKDAGVEAVTIVTSQSDSAVKKAIAEAEVLSQAIYFTRDVANEPPNVMTPVRLAQAAKEMASKNNLICRVLGVNEIKRLKMGGIIGVSQGSIYPPQLVILENKVSNRTSKNPIVLVGKGVCFDTGGISIKPSNDMDKMKFDMCGAAAVMGAMKAIANLKLPIKVIGITPLVENMPGSKAQRPGDIIKCFNGKTVEVLNTDAEGRLILADALSYAKKYNPKIMVDIATLTGACPVTFSDVASGLMGTDPELIRRIIDAGDYTGERCWELPLWDEYYDLIRATYADIQNISKKYAGTITAGMFLKEFADHTKSWAHLDVAGTAWADNAKPLAPIGATGMGVRLFVRLVKSYFA